MTKELASGDMLTAVTHKEHSNNLLKQTAIDGLAITVSRQRTLNSFQGLISELDLINGTETDILETLHY